MDLRPGRNSFHVDLARSSMVLWDLRYNVTKTSGEIVLPTEQTRCNNHKQKVFRTKRSEIHVFTGGRSEQNQVPKEQ